MSSRISRGRLQKLGGLVLGDAHGSLTRFLRSIGLAEDDNLSSGDLDPF